MDFEKACALARQWRARVDRQTGAARQPVPIALQATEPHGQVGLPQTSLDSNAKQREGGNS
jgi:hypothetical protein